MGDAASIPDGGARIPHAPGSKIQTRTQKQYCNRYIKTLKVVHVKKKKILKRWEKRMAVGFIGIPVVVSHQNNGFVETALTRSLVHL